MIEGDDPGPGNHQTCGAEFIPGYFFPAWIGGGALLGLALILMARLAPAHAPQVLLAAGVFAILSPLLVMRSDPKASILVDRAGVWMNGKLRVARPLAAHRVDSAGKVSVRVDGVGGRITLRGVGEKSAASLLHAANGAAVTVLRSVPHHHGAFKMAGVVALVSLAGAAMLSVKHLSIFLILPVALGVAAALGARRLHRNRTVLRIGDDGVVVTTEDERRFLPIADIVKCDLEMDYATAEGLRILMRDGRVEEVVFPSIPAGKYSRPEQPARGAKDAIERRLKEFRRAPRARHGSIAAMLPERGESTLEWVRALRALRDRRPDYREGAAPDVSEVLELVDDPTADPMLRVAAALEAEASPQVRVRIREAAGRSAQGLSEVLRLAAEEGSSEEELAAAIEAMQE